MTNVDGLRGQSGGCVSHANGIAEGVRCAQRLSGQQLRLLLPQEPRPDRPGGWIENQKIYLTHSIWIVGLDPVRLKRRSADG